MNPTTSIPPATHGEVAGSASGVKALAELPQPNYHPDFSSSNADVVLRSADGVLFRISSNALCQASTFFKSMLSLPQDSAGGPMEPIPMAEPTRVLTDLLSIIGAHNLPNLDDPDHLEVLLAAANKYEVPMVTSLVRMAFSSRFLDVSPIRLYGIACRMSWEKEAREASSRTFTTNLLAPAAQTELAALEPAHRDELLNLHRQRRESLLAGLDDGDTFYANVHGKCRGRDSTDPSVACGAPLDHSHWWALKYALVKRWDKAPLDNELDEAFCRMPEVWDMACSSCGKCGKKHYAMPATIGNINVVLRALPRNVAQ